MHRLVSLLGLFAMIFLAWLMSSHRRKISWRVIFGGLGLQFAFALIILRTDAGRAAFEWMGDVFGVLIGSVTAASKFMVGIGDDPHDITGQLAAHSFTFFVLPTIIFFSALMAMLYHLGVMQKIVELFAWLMKKALGTSGAESLSAAANIFVGQTEAPLVVRPYVAGMTLSELNTVMVGGFATIAGGVFAAYVAMGVDAGHLLTASVISAPAALLIAKVMEPETAEPQTLGRVKVHVEKKSTNLIEAIAIGATDGMKLALNVAAMLIAFIAIIAMINAGLGVAGGWFGQAWSLEAALGRLFAPLAWLMGIPWSDCAHAGELLGIKMVANEFLAYHRFGEWVKEGSDVQLAERSQLILTYALAGFANFGSIGIQIGGIGGIAPERRSDLARLGFRAMLGGTLACFMTACVAGVLL